MRHHLIAYITALPLFLYCGCSGTSDGNPESPDNSAGASTAAGRGGTSAAGASMGGNSNAATGGTAQGGSAGAQQAGSAGTAQGGSAGTAQGGNAGTTQGTGGAAGSQPGGAAGTSQAGSSGASTGTGGVAGSAGSSSGGMAGGGGAPTDAVGFFTMYCADCHSDQGAGSSLAPEIQHPVRDYTTWVVRHGLPGLAFPDPMEAVPPETISNAMLESIWDYLDEPPQPTTGEGLFHDYCANCHGADGKGGPTDRPITDELDKLKTQVREGAHPGQFDMRREYMPVFPTSRLSDAEVDLIYDYVESL